MKRRWFTYVAIGIIFGILDFYFTSHSTFWLFVVWLVPIIPISLYQAKVSGSRKLSALASSLTWFLAVIVYYITNVGQLAFGPSSQPWLRISNHNSPHFWGNWKSTLMGYALGHTVLWSIIAIVGGSIIGFLISSLFLLLSRNKKNA